MSRRWWLWAGVVSIGLFAFLIAGLTIVEGRFASTPNPVKNKAGLVVVQQRLSAARGDANAVADPVNSQATGAAHITGCSVGSGEVFEPALYREWRLLGSAKSAKYDEVTGEGRRVGSSIAAALIARGWTGSAAVKGPDYPATDLHKRYAGHKVSVLIQVFDDSVLLSGRTRHERVCRRHV